MTGPAPAACEPPGSPATRRGLFITLEGGEGAGKTTQIARLVAALADAGVEALRVREPGGTPGAEAIRRLLLGDGETSASWPPMSEALLFYAARVDLWTRVIAPALEAGQWVIADRFADSTVAYQGAAGGLGAERIAALHALVAPDARPDVTLVLDAPVEVGLARAQARSQSPTGAMDAFETRAPAFHQAVREAFLTIAAADPQRVTVIDATADQDAVAAAVWAVVSPYAAAARGQKLAAERARDGG